MGHHSKANMLAVRAALDALTLKKDGVDGKSVYLYGEGWNFGEVADNALFTQATQGQLGGTGIGTFSDRLRDAVRGGGPFDDDPRKQGFGSGESTDPNGDARGQRRRGARRLTHDTDLVAARAGRQPAVVLVAAQRRTAPSRAATDIDYNGQPAGYADQPDEVITYVDAHDNETLFDSLTYKLPVATTMADRVRMNTAVARHHGAVPDPVVLARGCRPAAQQVAGPQQLRQLGDWFNTPRLDRRRQRLRPRPAAQGATTRRSGRYMKPLLANPALKPTAADVQSGHGAGAGPAAAAVLHAAVPARVGRADQRQGRFPASAARPTPTRA